MRFHLNGENIQELEYMSISVGLLDLDLSELNVYELNALAGVLGLIGKSNEVMLTDSGLYKLIESKPSMRVYTTKAYNILDSLCSKINKNKKIICVDRDEKRKRVSISFEDFFFDEHIISYKSEITFDTQLFKSLDSTAQKLFYLMLQSKILSGLLYADIDSLVSTLGLTDRYSVYRLIKHSIKLLKEHFKGLDYTRTKDGEKVYLTFRFAPGSIRFVTHTNKRV